MRAVSLLRQNYPELPIIARARDRAECIALQQAGATVAVLEAMESGLHLGGAALRALGVEDIEASLAVERFRADNYTALSEIIPPGGRPAEASEHRR